MRTKFPKNKGINVLSLFDGGSSGQIALERECIQINKYFASEIDINAIKITQNNYPDTIQLGDVLNINLKKLPKIDLLLGGSPCQGFSYAGKQLLFNDPRSILFFEYVKIYKKLKKRNPKIKFMLENVPMNKKALNIISKKLRVFPVLINSCLVSAQNRKRYYWANFEITQPKNKNIMLNTIIGEGNIVVHGIYGAYGEINCRTYIKKSPTITTATGGGHIPSVFKGSKKEAKVLKLPVLRSKVRSLTPEEAEQLQTLPIGYTKGISNTQRMNIIGNGWTVDVIAHIFQNINKTKKQHGFFNPNVMYKIIV